MGGGSRPGHWLLPETKMNRTKVVDIIVVAYAFASGLILGLWIERLLLCLWPDALADTPIIRSSTGDPWTSFCFRKHHL
jgi:hypothetical protein